MARAELRGLITLARLHGLQTSYRDTSGARMTASADALQAVLSSIGVPVENQAAVDESLAEARFNVERPGLPPVAVSTAEVPGHVGFRPPPSVESVTCSIREEGGQVHEWRQRFDPRCLEPATLDLPALPAGYHNLTVAARGHCYSATILSTPGRAASWRSKGWGLFAPVYALRSDSNAGAGDVADLRQLIDVVADMGGSLIGTLPMLASFLDQDDFSPYSPLTRSAWNEFYAHVDEFDETAARKARSADLVDYPAVARIKREAIARAAERAHESGDWDSVTALASAYPLVDLYARFRAVQSRHGINWRDWPSEISPDAVPNGTFDPADYRYHLYAQWLMDRQMRGLAEDASAHKISLYLDLPIGTHPDGFDTWRDQHIYADGCNVGAPPDAFFAGGQDWGFRPMHPEALRQAAYRPVIEALRHHMSVAGVLRIDHVMSLHRLFWVPHGLGARQGVYVTYPSEELYAVVCIESARAGVPVVGEDLGTVPRAVRRTLGSHGLGTMYVVQFELRDEESALPQPPAGALASLNTHDTPTFAGWWNGADLDSAEALPSRRQRLNSFLQSRGLLNHPSDSSAEVAAATYRWLASTRTPAVLVNPDDLWGEERRQNMPGTTTEHPNWRRKFPVSTEELATDSALQPLRTLSGEQRGDTP